MKQLQVIVAGGGIGGLSLALSLHQAGIAVRVYEAVRDPSPLGVGINLQPTAVRELTGAQVCLTADLGPSERYRRWLAVLRGSVRISAGTRAAMFAPVHDLGLVVLWDDGDDLHAERRAPYPHAREVLALRAHRQGAAALIGGVIERRLLTTVVDLDEQEERGGRGKNWSHRSRAIGRGTSST